MSCRDGAAALLRGFGRRIRGGGAYDIDHRVDGICTFAWYPPCEACGLGHGLACHDVDCDDFEAPCPSQKNRLAFLVPKRGSRKQTIREGASRYVFRCLASAPGKPTTTTPPADNLTGDWLISDRQVTNTCTPGIEPVIAAHRTPSISQANDTVAVCGPAFIHLARATVSVAGVTADSGNCCGIGGSNASYDYRQQLSVALPATSEGIDVNEHWQLTPVPAGGAPCERVSQGIMTRVDPRCMANLDCITADPCSRCLEGGCRADPLFR